MNELGIDIMNLQKLLKEDDSDSDFDEEKVRYFFFKLINFLKFNLLKPISAASKLGPSSIGQKTKPSAVSEKQQESK